LTQPVTLLVGPYSVTLPPGSFKKGPFGTYYFDGMIIGVELAAAIAPTGTLRYAFDAFAFGPNLTGIANPVPVSLTIGTDSGSASVNAFTIYY
jgi:hypothetical protein